MYSVGLDYHQGKSVFQVLDENGNRIALKTVRGTVDNLIKELSEVEKPFQVCFEASTGYGYLHDRLKGLAERVVVGHPGKLRLIFRSKRKNDRIDAERLAKLLYLNEVPPAYVPGEDVRAWRGMIEHRGNLIQERTRTKNSLRALLRSHGIVAPRRVWTKQGVKWLSGVSFANRLDTIRRDNFLERLASLNRMVRDVERELSGIGRRHPGVQLLMSIPGVGIRTAESVVAYIDNPYRFRRSKSIGNYFGLIPCEHTSADKVRMGHITRQGPGIVRKLLTEASWQAIRRSPRIRAFFERVANNDPQKRNIAVIATAHYLARVMLAMLKTGETWREEVA